MRTLCAPLLCLLAASATAQPAGKLPAPPPGQGHVTRRPPVPMLEFADYLEITPDQMAKIQKVLEGHRDSVEAKRVGMRQARQSTMTTLANPALSEAQVKELHAKESKLQLEVMLEEHAALKEAAALLTPAQQEKYQKVCAELPLIRILMKHAGGREEMGRAGGPPRPQGRNAERPGMEPPAQGQMEQGRPGMEPPPEGAED